MTELEKENYKFIFLTLTMKNCSGAELKATIDLLMKSFNRMFDRPSMDFVKGWFRGLEVTYNEQEKTYHPHFHCVLAVNQSYFTSRDYVKKMEWVSIWQQCLKVDYEPNVDIRVIKDETKEKVSKMVSEVAKYTVKDTDYLKDDLELSKELVKTIDDALFKRRLVAFGGRFKELHKELSLDDAEDGNLANVDGEELREDLSYVIERFSWFNGVAGRNYYKL
jgi:plasmid rolling circle replication initiator protein Rep